jgi:hypothetical protein
MRRFPWGWAIFVLAIAVVGVDYWLNFSHEAAKLNQVAGLQRCPSAIYLRLTIRYANPPVYVEEYRMQDIEGASSASYRIEGYSGKQIMVTMPPRSMYDVSFLFGKLDHQDGIWDVTNRPPRGNTNAEYTVYVKQVVDCKQGDRTITFTDPHYWATAAGHQYHINLASAAPKTETDLLRMQSTTLNDPRYAEIVNDFRAFGPDTFRAKVITARKAIR